MALVPWNRLPEAARHQLRAFPHDSEPVDPGSPGASPSIGAILQAFDDRWDRGERPCAGEYLGVVDEAEALELIYHEFCRAEVEGLDPDPTDYMRRYPAQSGRLARLFGLHEAFDAPGAAGSLDPEDLPQAGDEIGPYRLLRELGRGSFARVFLAEQADLASRLVVVKVAVRATPEPGLLARAQHPHIVGILRHIEANDGALNLICMPFLGGATLAQVLTEGGRRGGGRSGRDLLAALDRVASPEYRPIGSRSPTRELIAALPKAKAVAWLIARLAEALDHAHRRGVSHGDVKPSNVLLTADGSPMLLDFNLALDWFTPGDAGGSGEPGGTLAYMAPERLRALAEGSRSERPGPAARHRADLYALGLILAESLGVTLPAIPEAGRSSPRALAARLAQERGAAFTRRVLRRVPGALRPIVGRCLASDPADRYGSASELATDLDSYRDDLPPRFAANLQRTASVVSRMRRHRRSLAAAGLVSVVGLAAAAGMSRHGAVRQREMAQSVQESLLGGNDPDVIRLRRQGGYGEAGTSSPAARALRHLGRYDVLGRGDWRLRDDVRFLPDSDRGDLHVWLMEQAWRYGAAIADRPAPKGSDLDRARLALARTLPGGWPGPLADLDGRLRELLGASAAESYGSSEVVPRWMEQYLRGVAAEGSRPAVALEHFRTALSERPESFWVRYRMAVAAWKVKDYRAAASSLRVCIERRPENPQLRIAQAGLYCYLGRPDLAHDQLQRAVRLDPESADAYRTFAFSRFALGQRDQLAADLARFDQLEQERGLRDSWAALQDARWLLASAGQVPPVPPGELRRLRVAAGEDINARVFLACCLDDAGEGQDALEQARLAYESEPGHVVALLTYALLLQKFGQPSDAAEVLGRLIEHPRFDQILADDEQALEVYRYLASDLLGFRKIDEARAVLRRGLKQLEGRDADDRSLAYPRLRGEFHYSLARVDAAEALTAPERVRDAAGHLQLALRDLPNDVPRWYRVDTIFEPFRETIGELPGLESTP
jgi:serine/threonine protein kinase/tetratricopeptide (TPR) repeat protein